MLGLLFFTKGFLLTRLVLDSQSQCHVLPDGRSTSVQNGCWHPKKFDKAVVIVIDALRYDFTIPSHAAPADRAPGHHLDNLPFLYNTAVEQPEHAFLLPFIADPPTTTLQRLKALTTGTLPVFIDAGSSFDGNAIEEDNLVSHLNSSGKRIVHLGDDTWHRLFPDHFDSNLTHAYHSFTTYDLHTVDNGVIEHITPLLEKQNHYKWDVIFAHFLGVDHAGHRYGPNHPAMAEKLHQMDQVLSDIARSLDESTLLVVMGDHGMDAKGDHGGESDDEVEAALWMYSKAASFGRTEVATSKPPSSAKERPVGQIDLASTLALLLGLPIPFNNLGTPIAEAFTTGIGRSLQNLAEVELLAFDQIQQYHGEYSSKRDLGANEAQYKLSRDVKQAMQTTGKDRWSKLHMAYLKWHKETITMYRSLWASFDVADMFSGVLLSALALVTLFILSRLVIVDKANLVPGLLRSIGTGTAAGVIIGPLLGVVLPAYFTSIAGCVFGLTFGGITFAIAHICYQRQALTTSRMPSLWGWLSMIFCVTQSAGFAANSFTIHEDSILMFFLSTFGAISLMSSVRQGVQADQVLGSYQSVVFILLTRLSSYSRLCREEQIPGCRSTFYASETSSTSAPWHLLIPFVVALLMPEIIKAFYKGTASYAASAGFWIGFSSRIGLALVALYWTLDTADNANWLDMYIQSDTVKTISITVARCALAIAIPVGIGTFVWAKPCIDISIEQAAPASAMQQSRPQVKILGYANAFGSRFFLMLPMLMIITSLLLPPMGQFSVALCTWQILCLMEILDANSLTVNQVRNSAIGPVVLAMLGSYHFFKTGHQAVLSTIQWNAAFIPLRTIRYPWSPLLLMFNTFGAQIICAAAVPLIAIWKRPIYKDGLRGLWNDVTNACLTHILYYATIQLATTMWAGHLRRHLMLYRVFMPRFLMASGVLLIVDMVLLFAALPSVRVTGLSVGEIFGY